jgi:hypothetical protein
MAHFRNFFAAAVMTFVLAGATLAGDGIIYGGYGTPTPTPTPLAPMSNFVVGDTPAAPPPSDEVTATDIAIESVLRVLGGLLLY